MLKGMIMVVRAMVATVEESTRIKPAVLSVE